MKNTERKGKEAGKNKEKNNRETFGKDEKEKIKIIYIRMEVEEEEK